MGSDITVGVVEAMSCSPKSVKDSKHVEQLVSDLLQQVGRQHQHLSIRTKALNSSQVSHPLLMILWRRHDLEHME